jgi:hypothetical protein
MSTVLSVASVPFSYIEDEIYDIYGGMAMIQMLSPEIGKIVEKRHEMI